jgi:hypothetical protein
VGYCGCARLGCVATEDALGEMLCGMIHTVDTNIVEVYKSIKRNESTLVSCVLFNVFIRVCLKPETSDPPLPIMNIKLILP